MNFAAKTLLAALAAAAVASAGFMSSDISSCADDVLTSDPVSQSAAVTSVPARNSITKLTSGNGGIRVEWNADSSALGYQILYSQDKSFKTYHSTTVKTPSRTYVNLTNVPKAGETWYVKVRSFITADGSFTSTRYGTYSEVKSITTYVNINKVTVPYISYTYSGKEIKPTVKVKDAKGNIIPAGNYTASYSNNVNVGIARITVTGKGIAKGTYVKEFYVKPAKNEITSLTSAKGAFKLSWKKGTPGTVGYQVLYSTTADFSDNVHSYTSTKLDDLSENFSKVPRAGETWYVKVRSFFTRDSKTTSTRYGNYSTVKSVTTVNETKKVTKAAGVYSQAAFSQSPLGTVSAGTTVNILGQSGRWYKISSGSLTGWGYNKAFGVTSNASGRLTGTTVHAYADDVIFDIGTSAKAINRYVMNSVRYAHLAAPTTDRDGTAAYAFTYHQAACYHFAAAADILLEHAGYVHKIVKGHSTTGTHHWNIYMTASGWRYMDTTPFVVYPSGFYDFTADQVKNIRQFTWDPAEYEN